MTKQPKSLRMSMKEISEQWQQFRPGPGVEIKELPLLEKQALVDEAFRGVPIRSVTYFEKWEPDGKYYYVTQGWPQLSALIEFTQDKFPTWSDEDREKWQKGQREQ